MKPYPNLASHNLGLLLLIARMTAVIGILFLVIAIVVTLITLSGGITALAGAMLFVPAAISILLLSGIMAVLVSFEENYRKRTLVFVNNNEPIKND